MNVLAVAVSILILCLGGILAQTNLVNNDEVCKNSRGMDGTCISRRLCDYGTSAIDRNPYSPRGYKNPCAAVEGMNDNICCPFGSQITEKADPTTKSGIKDMFADFDK